MDIFLIRGIVQIAHLGGNCGPLSLSERSGLRGFSRPNRSEMFVNGELGHNCKKLYPILINFFKTHLFHYCNYLWFND